MAQCGAGVNWSPGCPLNESHAKEIRQSLLPQGFLAFLFSARNVQMSHSTGLRLSPCPKESNLASLLYQMEQCHGTLVVSNPDIIAML